MSDKKPEEALSPPQRRQKEIIAGMEEHLPQLQRLQNRQRRVLAYHEKLAQQMNEASRSMDRSDPAALLAGIQKSAALHERGVRAMAVMDRLVDQFNAQMDAALETQRGGFNAYVDAQIEHDVCYGGVQKEISTKPLPSIKKRNPAHKK